MMMTESLRESLDHPCACLSETGETGGCGLLGCPFEVGLGLTGSSRVEWYYREQ